MISQAQESAKELLNKSQDAALQFHQRYLKIFTWLSAR
jgi:hypothetical protein